MRWVAVVVWRCHGRTGRRRRRPTGLAAAAPPGRGAGLRRAVAQLEPRPPRRGPGRHGRSAGVRRRGRHVVFAASWPAGRSCRWRIPAGCAPATSRCGRSVRAGQLSRGHRVGKLMAGHPGCAAAACLHWGAMWGPARTRRLRRPAGLVGVHPIRLKPLHLRALNAMNFNRDSPDGSYGTRARRVAG